MNKRISALVDVAAAIIPALGSLAEDDKSGKLGNEIADVLSKVTKKDNAGQVKAEVEADPAVKAELEKRLAELANQQAERENRAAEEKRRLELDKAKSDLDDREQKHQHQLDVLEKDLDSTNAARAFAQKSALSEKGWVSGINPLLSIIITFAFLVFIYLIATYPLEKTDGAGVVHAKDVFLVAFGALATAFATVIGFHFGSSAGSKRKTQLQRIYGTRGTFSSPSPQVSPSPQEKSAGVPEGKDDKVGQPLHPFEAFWMENLAHIEHFNWEELLFKGASNARFKTNTDPDPSLYRNAVPLVNLLEKIRKEIGAPVKLTSVYRSPAYNRDVGGATSSRHMQFDAADFQALGSGAGNSERWFQIAKKLRDKGEFKGGIGVYRTFVHVDTRGHNATWDNR